MNFEKLIEWGAIILVAFLGLRWIMGAFEDTLNAPSASSIPYAPGGIIAAEPYGVLAWSPYGYAGNWTPRAVNHRGNRRG